MTASDPQPAGVSVVVPAYDEAARLPATLAALCGGMDDAVGPDWEIIVADDGSTDGTAEIAAATGDGRVRLVTIGRHRGKGAALAAGFGSARYEHVVFLDADLPVPVAAWADLLHRLGDADIVVGRRNGDGVVRAQPVGRRIGGRLFLLAVGAIGLSTTSDPQCGLKLLRRSACAPVIAAIRSDGFAFDIELLRRARRAGLTIAEAPVQWRHVEGSSIRPVRDAVRTLADLIAVRRALR